MSDQTLSDNHLEWDVDWSATKTWWTFIALCALIALVLVVGSAGFFGLARWVASITHEDWAKNQLGIVDPEAELPFLHSVVAFIVMYLALVLPVNRWARRSSGPMPTDDFPIGLFLDKQKNHYGWLIFIMALYSAIFFGSASLDAGIFSIATDNHDYYPAAAIMLIFTSRELKALFWRCLAERRTVEAWGVARRVPSRWTPDLVIGLLAAVCSIAFLLTAVLILA